MNIFEVLSVLGRKVRLTQVGLNHISEKHPEVAPHMGSIIETLIKPHLVCYDVKKNNFHYYRFYNDAPIREKFMLVITKHLNGEGFIITSCFTNKIKGVRCIWPN